MFSTDPRLAETNSETRERLKGFGLAASEVHIVLTNGGAMETERLTENVFLHLATASGFFARLWNAYRIGKRILTAPGPWLISAQDPFEIGLIGYFLKVARGVPLELQVHTDFMNSYFIKSPLNTPSVSSGIKAVWDLINPARGRGEAPDTAAVKPRSFIEESPKQRIRVLIAKFLLPKAEMIRAVSERIRRSIVDWKPALGPRIGVLPVFIDVERLAQSVAAKDIRAEYRGYETVVLMMSRLTREKNIGLALTAMRDVVAHHPKTLLLIVGEGPELHNLQLTTRNLQLEKNVVFESWVDNPSSYYRSADIFLLTSNYEGYGRTMVEAMASWLPIVMTDVGIAGEVLRDHENGRVVSVGDAGAVSAAIIDCIEHPEERKRFGEAAHHTVASLPNRRDYFEKVYERFHSIKPKLCYVLPRYEPKTATHFAYIIDFVEALGKSYDVFLLIERGTMPERDVGAAAVSVLRARSAASRFLELLGRLIAARLAGYRTLYVHYSFGAAFLATCVGARVFYWNCGEPWKYQRHFLRDAFERLTYRRVHRLVTGTEGMKRAYAAHYALPLEKIEVMPNWINVSKIKYQISKINIKDLKNQLHISENQKVILFVHRLSKRKGAHHLPEILAKLKDKHAILLIVGDGPERESLKFNVESLKLRDRVRFVGAIPSNQLTTYYSFADVFLMPSDEEGFPHALLEAMAFGVPFVVSDVGGVKEIVPQERYTDVVPAGDISQFAAQVDALLQFGSKERERISASLREWVLRFRMEDALQAFKKFLPC